VLYDITPDGVVDKICSKIVSTNEPYSNMNKLFYHIDNKIYTSPNLTGPNNGIEAYINVDKIRLEPLTNIIVGFGPSSDESDESVANNKNLDDLSKSIKLQSDVEFTSVEQLVGTNAQIMLRAKVNNFDCIGMWDAQYNKIKVYFFYPFMTTGGGFHYSQKYQVSELIENNTMRVEKVHDGDVLSKIHCNNYIGLEDDGRLPNIKFVKEGNTNKGIINNPIINNPEVQVQYAERLSMYETPDHFQTRINLSQTTNMYELPQLREKFKTGGDNIPDCYAMTYIIKK